MKVIMNTTTHFRGLKIKGKEYDVDSVIARRWEANGIATIVEKEVAEGMETEEVEEVETEEVEAEEIEAEADYSKMSAKKLYALCKENNLDVKAKQAKEYYIEKLNELK